MSRIAIIYTVFILCTVGCMDPLKNYDECVEIETARCALRQDCKGVGDFDAEFPNFEYDTCVAYAEEHCRTTELADPDCDPNLPACVDACVAAIEALAPDFCDDLEMNYNETADLPACDFLMADEDEEEPDAGSNDAG